MTLTDVGLTIDTGDMNLLDGRIGINTEHAEYMLDVKSFSEIGSCRTNLIFDSTLGHRVYSFEPTPSSYARATQALSERGIPWTEQADGFQHAAPGTVLALNAAASNESGSIVLSMACFRPWKSDGSCDEKGGGYANSLHGGAIPAFYKRREVRVKQLTLSDVLAHEPAGVYMLKIDAQGHEHHVLQGARRYLSKLPIHMILLEFSPKLLRAAGSDPVALLRLLQHT